MTRLPLPAFNRVAGANTEPMTVASPPKRRIEEVPSLLVVLLNDGGKVPPIPNEPSGGVGFRPPSLFDMDDCRWIVYWAGKRFDESGFRPVAGLANFKDFYDWHTSSDVRELLSIRGSRRAIVELIRWTCNDAARENRRVVSSIEKKDGGLIGLVRRLGCTPSSTEKWESAA